ncbi:UNVERIFIED_CONTAM: hypothetical protein Sradi_0767700 [Sesamum radiatum]|uniref:Uncharacterized protein n=1 Tax=Sesamum radiatum TaxID=300843 RepID=A0AAW2VTX1_SESRA
MSEDVRGMLKTCQGCERCVFQSTRDVSESVLGLEGLELCLRKSALSVGVYPTRDSCGSWLEFVGIEVGRPYPQLRVLE